VRVNLHGVERLDAILVPQRAVAQSAKGHFVYVVDTDNKIEFRAVEAGDWYRDQWFINSGLAAGDRVVVDGGAMLAPGTPVTAAELER
jgi:membrane fusion protein (multidrug efflux system)